MVNLVDLLLEIGHLGPEHRAEIEWELALAQRSIANVVPLKRSRAVRVHTRIQWDKHFPWLRERLSEAQNHRCCWNGCRMSEDGPIDSRPTFEHVIPLFHGGADSPENLAIACSGCNNRRGHRVWSSVGQDRRSA